jgi:adenine deaminase
VNGRGRARLIAVARGDERPDTVVEGASVFCAHTREWLTGDVAIADGMVAGIGSYEGGERIDARGKWLVPGFIDAHMHVESSKLTPAQFARAVLPHGTTAIVCDPHEVANVLGSDGVHWMLDASEGLPLAVYVMAPSCVPASAFESPRRELTVGDMEAILRRKRALGVAEMMNFPGVIAGDPDVLAKLEVRGASHADGHAPGVLGRALDAYTAAGIRSDHEATTVEEALAKRRRGMWVLLREASNARNLRTLLPLVRELGPAFCAFCTDDREPDMLLREGHINQMCRTAVAEGVPVEDVLVMATLHAAQAHRLDGHGAIAPGFRADLVVLDDLTEFRPSLVLAGGRIAARDGATEPFELPATPAHVLNTVRSAPLRADDLSLEAGGDVRVIEIVPEQLITIARTVSPARSNGHVVTDPARDLAKIAVIERHHATGRVGRGLVTGFGLRAGAFASTVAHDAHNVVAVGVDDASILGCVARLQELGGGCVVASGGAVTGELPLPVAGLLSDRPVEEVVERLEALHAQLRDLGVEIEAPFMTLSFLALSVIPALKITDRGLVDVDRFEIVPLAVGGRSDSTPARPQRS